MGKDALKSKGWETDSGLPDDFTHLVAEAWFGPNEESERDPDKIYLNLRGPALDAEGEPVGDDDGYVLRFGVGKHWEAVKQGSMVEHANGATKFNRNSGCGHLVTAIGEVVEAGAEELEALLKKRGAPTNAKTFTGLAFRYQRKVVSTFKSEDTGENVNWELPLPVAFVGTEESDLGPQKKAKKTAVKATKVSDDDDEKPAKKAKGDDSALRAKVVKFAAQYDKDEFEDFTEEVFDADIFKAADSIGEELKAEILDEDVIWAESRKAKKKAESEND